MWEYAHQLLELSASEHEHVVSCPMCLDLFKMCLTAKEPDLLDRENKPPDRQNGDDNFKGQKRSA